MTAIVDKYGKLLFNVTGNAEVIKLNTPEECIAVENPPEPNMYYQDGWVVMPPQPTPYHIFNYATKDWVDPRSINEIKYQRWVEIKSIRDQLEFGGFEYAGNVYDSDQVSQGRIMGAAAAGIDQVWTLADNTTVNLTGNQLKELYEELQDHIASVHERGRTARQMIEAAQTVEEVEAVSL